MTTYKGINGFAVQSVASDPTFDEGQVWYNNASYAFKLATLTTSGTFASGGNMNTARRYLAGAGTQAATVVFGGYIGAPTAALTAATESYNGTSWTSSPNVLNTARKYLGGCGTQTAALGFGGDSGPISAATESWNGTSWTSVNSLNSARYGLSSANAATQTAALAFGGNGPTGATELWNGTSWTSNPTGLTTARYGSAGSGTQTSGLVSGGNASPDSTATEEWTGPGVPQTKTITTS